MYVSVDKGNTFSTITSSNTLIRFSGVSENKIWFVRNDSLMVSADTGKTFKHVALDVSAFYRFNVYDKVISLQGSKDYTSFDEGENWKNNTSRIFPIGKLYDGQDLAYKDVGNGYWAMYRSLNKGQTWIEFGNGHHRNSGAISSSNQTWLTGGHLIYYEDGYPNWRHVGVPHERIMDAEFTKNGIYLAGASKNIYYSHDGGKLWDLRQHLKSWPAASCLSIHPDGRVLVAYGRGEKLDIYDYQLLNKEITKGFPSTINEVNEILWFKGKCLGLFNDANEIKYPFLGDQLLIDWKLQTRFPMQAGVFLDGVVSPLSVFVLVDGKHKNQPQIAYTLLPNSSAYYWNVNSFRCKQTGKAKSIAYSKSGGKILVQYFDNNIYIANNKDFSRKWTELKAGEIAEKIQFDRSNHLWVFTNQGVYKSDRPLVFQ